jgi:acetyl esterase
MGLFQHFCTSGAKYEQTLDNAKDLSINKDKIFLYGNSAGANLASVVAQRARDQGIKLSGQFLRIPALAHYEAAPDESFSKFEQADILNSQSMRTFFKAYLSKDEDPDDPQISPLLGNVEGLPPAYLQIAGRDRKRQHPAWPFLIVSAALRDSALAYYEKLKAAG